ncbi:hypothetical protein CEV32_4207 [Brucella rhizosphaerae]|uniref:Uncharacterized protein n=1 Tax=Brucella rhizosphaerae TaxID=571254 RepID=A0A256FNZ0_9HYPH|nr:hypothetical protein CEV32_4207 [Brucella rhizosphaerae]
MALTRIGWVMRFYELYVCDANNRLWKDARHCKPVSDLRTAFPFVILRFAIPAARPLDLCR